MKKSLLVLIAVIAAIAGYAQSFDYEGITYTVLSESDKTCELTDGKSASGNVTIPATVPYNGNDYTVVSIGEFTFVSCRSLTEINLPVNLTTIGDHAFWYCSSLTSINIPEGVTTIGGSAFNGCSSLSSIDLPGGLTTIGDAAFFDCSSLSSIDLPGGLTTIGVNSFSFCHSLSSIDLPGGLTTIGDRAFWYCSSLSSIDLPGGLTTIGEGAFSECSSLSSIDLPGGLTTIGDGAFSECSSLALVNSYSTYTPFCYGYDVFLGIPEDATLHVPEGTRADYAAATGWSVFKNIVDDLPNVGEEIPAICAVISLSDKYIQLEKKESSQLIIDITSLRPGRATLTVTLTDESGEEITKTCDIVVVKDTSDVEALFADEADELVNIYSVGGVLLKSNVAPEAVLELPAGIYIVGDKKVLVK